ncbi:MAG: DUF294 nucleotidyltransferase-like domain-containing protein [Schleiferiaceae bacterium]|nr:DUF294 nucleotidyltransferase-like domain-containing protein [Schleiferiaceae bacterium]
MSANQISKRVAEFLQQFPPFQLLPLADLMPLANEVDIRYIAKSALLFEEGQKPNPEFYVVREGSVRIESSHGDILYDICDVGDVFGVRALLANDNYLASAKADEDALVYAIPLEAGRKIIDKNPQIALYFASGFASGKALAKATFKKPLTEAASDAAPDLLNSQVRLSGRKKLVTCSPSASIRDAALVMTAKKVGSVLVVNEKQEPLGIITDRDFRTKVATGLRTITEAVTTIMSAPVLCSPPDLTQTEYLVEMLNRQVHHLCITADGTSQSTVVGMITEHDLLLEQGANPAVILREMHVHSDYKKLRDLRLRAAELLKRYINNNVDTEIICRIATAINEKLTARLLQLAIEELGPPPCEFCWIALGSLGRSEQIQRTDQDHALILEKDGFETYFLTLANRVSSQLEYMGFENDPAGIMANNPKWCVSLRQWKTYFHSWIEKPDKAAILLTTIFIDFKPLGTANWLAEELRETLIQLVQAHPVFLGHLASDALTTPPPLSFFRNLILEREGPNKNEFDLKLRAALPLIDCGRVLALHAGITTTNTAARFRKLMAIDTNNQELFESAGDAITYIIRMKAQFGFTNNDSGRYFDPQQLGKLEQQSLRNIFDIISQLQQILEVRFQTAYIR